MLKQFTLIMVVLILVMSILPNFIIANENFEKSEASSEFSELDIESIVSKNLQNYSLLIASNDRWVCPNCGHTNDEDNKFCSDCGFEKPVKKISDDSLTFDISDYRICPNCGTINPKESKFCSDCGFQFKSDILAYSKYNFEKKRNHVIWISGIAITTTGFILVFTPVNNYQLGPLITWPTIGTGVALIIYGIIHKREVKS